MKMKLSICAALVLAFFVAPPGAAQQISAPGWNKVPGKTGELRFKHVSGQGTISVNIIDAVPDDEMTDFLRSAMEDLDANGACPTGQHAVVASAMDGKAWQAHSYGNRVCLITAKRIDAKKFYFIIASETKDSGTGAEKFAWDLLYGLSGETKKVDDKKKAEEAAYLAKNPPLIRPTKIPNSGKIVAVFFDNTRQHTSWTPGLNTMVQSTEFFVDTEVLFSDGTACKDCLEDWTNDPSLAQYRKDNPNDIGRWTRTAGGFSIRYSDSDAATIKLQKDNVKAVAAGKRFNNYVLASVNGSTIGTGASLTQNVRTDTLFLGADGRFAWSVEGSSLRQNMGGGYNNTTGEYSSPDYRSTGPTTSGRYAVSDYGIKLEYNDGKTEVLSLLTFPAEPDFLIIDGLSFLPKKD
jgi:hypothetical protein